MTFFAYFDTEQYNNHRNLKILLCNYLSCPGFVQFPEIAIRQLFRGPNAIELYVSHNLGSLFKFPFFKIGIILYFFVCSFQYFII